MVAPIVDPHVPYTGHIAEGLHPGKMVRIQGIADQDGERFDINLQSGAGGEEAEQDVGLHLSVRLAEGYIARNSYQRGDWEDEQGDGDLPIGLGQRFELLILCDSNEYKIAVNGRHFCGFPFRVPYSQISYLQIKGDVHLTLISWEGTHEPSAPEDYSTKANLMHNAAPQAGYAPPTSEYVSQGVYGGPPPYGNPGAPAYGAPGYGPPGYGPGAPPQGPQQQSGLESFLGSAQSAITGAIASGAAQKLLSSIMSSNKTEQSSGGFNPQNAQYGQYPHGQNMYQQYPQGAPQEPQSHGFLDSLGGQEVVGSMLSNLAGQIFSGPKGGNRF